jgi:hypothetical protein
MATSETDPLSIDPVAVGAAADGVRRQADVIAAMARPAGTGIIALDDSTARSASRYPSGVTGLEALLAEFERARAGYDQQVFEALRHVSDHLALIAVDAVTADTAEYLHLPEAGG